MSDGVERTCYVVYYGSRLLHPLIDGVFIGTEPEAQRYCRMMTQRTGIPFWIETTQLLDGMQNWVDPDNRYFVPWMMPPVDVDDEDE